MGSNVPIQSLQMNPVEVCLTEDIVDQGSYRIGTIALIPVITVANRDTQLGFALSLINAIISAVTDVLAIQSLYSKPAFS